MAQGLVREIIVRFIDQTNGKQSVSDDVDSTLRNTTGKQPTGKKGSGAEPAEEASTAGTDINYNAALQVAMPVLNAATDGMAGNVISRTRQTYGLINRIAEGASAGAIAGAAASLSAYGVQQLVSYVQNRRRANDALADSLRQTNVLRQMAGLPAYGFSQSGITRKIIFGENR